MIFDILAFIQYHILEGIVFQQFNISAQQSVSRQYYRIAVKFLPRLTAPLVPCIFIYPQGTEPLYLSFPIRKQGGRNDNKRGLHLIRLYGDPHRGDKVFLFFPAKKRSILRTRNKYQFLPLQRDQTSFQFTVYCIAKNLFCQFKPERIVSTGTR